MNARFLTTAMLVSAIAAMAALPAGASTRGRGRSSGGRGLEVRSISSHRGRVGLSSRSHGTVRRSGHVPPSHHNVSRSHFLRGHSRLSTGRRDRHHDRDFHHKKHHYYPRYRHYGHYYYPRYSYPYRRYTKRYSRYCYVPSYGHLYYSPRYGSGLSVHLGYPYSLGLSYYRSEPYYSAPTYSYHHYEVEQYVRPEEAEAPREGGYYPKPVVPDQAERQRKPREPAEAEEGDVFRSALSARLGGSGLTGAEFTLGEERLKEGDYEEAVTAFQRVVLARPDRPEAKLALALAYAGQGHHGSAATMLRRGLAGVPDLGALRFDPAEVYGGPRRYAQIVQALEAEAAEDGDEDARLVLGFLLLAGGRPREASDALWAAYEDGSTDPILRELLLAAQSELRR